MPCKRIPDQCQNCGGTMIGDGYTSVRHCENATDLDSIAEAEADAGPIYCEQNAALTGQQKPEKGKAL